MSSVAAPPKQEIKRLSAMSTATEKALKAKAEMESLFQAAIDEQLGIIKEAEQRLGELGYGAPTKKAGKTGITRQRDPNAPCSVCNFATDPGHDGRVHRSQGDKKKPFTAAELAEKGYKKR
jgi:hypothetical protein